MRLDILIKDNFPAHAYGYELVIAATKSIFDEHLERAKKYSELHNCTSMYVVNLCNITNSILSSYFGEQEGSTVIPVHIIYDLNYGEAKLVYRNDITDVSINSFDWEPIWKVNEKELRGYVSSDKKKITYIDEA